MRYQFVSLILLTFLYGFSSQVIVSSPDPECLGTVNNKPLYYTEPILIKTVPNGKKYILQNDTVSLTMVVVNGSSFAVGKAYGELLEQEIHENIKVMMEYFLSIILQLLPPEFQWIQYVPQYLQMEVLDTLLDQTYVETLPYTSIRYQEEYNGIAEGAKINPMEIIRFNLMPELTRAACTIMGIWGPATPGGKLIQMRALDWNHGKATPGQQYPLITVYKFNHEGSQNFANFGWVGMIGSLAGYSTKIGLSQAENDTHNKTITSQAGTPWMYVLRDLLEFSVNLSTSVEFLQNAHRTWQIRLGVGSLEDNNFLAFDYAHKLFEVWTDKNYTDHPVMEGVFYFNNVPCLYETLSPQYGNITAEYLYRTVAPLRQTGQTILAIYDFADQIVYLSYQNFTTGYNAFNVSMTVLNMTQIFNL